jgi:PBSX family phage portal protein
MNSDTSSSTETIEVVVPTIDRIGHGPDTQPSPIESDPFAAKAEDIRKYDGLDANFKRRLSRIEKGYTGAGDAASKQTEVDYFSGYMAFDVVMPPYNLDYLASIYEISSPHYSACNAKVSNIVGLGYSWEESPKTIDKIESASPEELEKIRKKLNRIKMQLDQWLDTLNAEDTFLEVLSKVWTDYEATGNGYIEVGRKRDGSIGYVGHIPSKTMRIRRLRDGYVQVVTKVATFFRNFGDTTTSDPIGSQQRPNEIIHIKKYSPTNTFYGVPDIVAAKNALAGDEFASRFNLDYFEHKAVPRYVISLKGAELSRTAEQELHEFFLTNLKGKNHRTLYVPLPADSANSKVEFKMDAVEAGTQDSSFNQYKIMNRDEILMAHRVPVTKLGIAANVALAVARDADKTFKEQVCQPEQDRLEKRVNSIIRERTDIYTLKLNELSLTDAETQSKIHERALRNQQMTINESRAEVGLPPHPDGDRFFEPTTRQAADARNTASQSDARGRSRSSGATDSAGEGRSTQGDGRSSE